MATQTLYRQELKGRILEMAMQEFKTNGIRKVKMDDIARMLGISKRTLYEIYQDKEAILFEGIKKSEEEMDAYLRRYAEDPSHTAMDIIIEFYHIQVNNISRINPLFFTQLYKYPEITDYLEVRRKERENTSREFYAKGVSEGYFRDNVVYEIISAVGNSAVQYVMANQLYKRYSFDEIFRNIFFLIIRGFCTEKGVAVIDRLL
ncbi:MAG: TetR/AcrR family transcriptional regulator [Prevotella sp.]